MYISEITKEIPDKFENEVEELIFNKLKELNIDFERIDNDEANTMESCIELDKKLGAEIRKTVFVCNRQKTQYYLVVLPADKPFVTKDFSREMECSRVSFASVDDLLDIVGVTPGSASVLCSIKDVEGKVQVVIDKPITEEEYFSCNTGTSLRHIKIKTKDLLEVILPNIDHEAKIVEL